VSSALAPKVKAGRLLMMWMRPAEALRPNKVPWGPAQHFDALDFAEFIEADAAA
jgi:hypothetical protein